MTNGTDWVTAMWAEQAAENDQRRRLYGEDEYGNPLEPSSFAEPEMGGMAGTPAPSLVSPESSGGNKRRTTSFLSFTAPPPIVAESEVQLWKLLRPEERQDFEVAVQPSTLADDIWRHAGWTKDRRRVFEVLRKTASKGTIDRFCNCGSCATVKYSPSSCQVMISASFCRNRWCVPCAKARAREDEARLRAIVLKEMDQGERIRLVTLTQRGYQGESLATCLRRMKANWDSLRKSEFWRERVDGGCAVTEVKRGKSGAWHVHRHLIVSGRWIDQAELSAEWEQITEDSYRVFVESPRDAEDCVHYATKYASKPIPPEVYRNPDDLAEAILALKGVRLFDYLGTWRKQQVDQVDRPGDWIRVATLHQLARRAAAGDAEAWSWLTVAAHHAVDDLVNAAPPPPDPLPDDTPWDECSPIPKQVDYAPVTAAIWQQITAGRREYLFTGVAFHV